jgi:hypothetical protein
MMKERGIEQEWVDRCLNAPDKKEELPDGTRHFLKQIPEFGNRWLRVVIDATVSPPGGITLFFDRRLRRDT